MKKGHIYTDNIVSKTLLNLFQFKRSLHILQMPFNLIFRSKNYKNNWLYVTTVNQKNTVM